jgi:hypothetical protein
VVPRLSAPDEDELAKFIGQFTSAEGIKNLLEYFESSEKLMDLRKNMLRE